MKTTIVIPARYQSTRLPGKPLAMIKGQTMLSRVVAIARAAALHNQVDVLVASEDTRILAHCEQLGVECIMTPAESPSGTDRCAQAIALSGSSSDFILNLQGDAPLTPPDFLVEMIGSFAKAPCDVVTPVTQLTWAELDLLRSNKTSTPFSGTTAVFNQQTGKAYWFSKNIIPAIRNEATMRKTQDMSPVFRHIGLYGYSKSMLEHYQKLSESTYEALEGLEQLRLIEHGFDIRCVPVDFKGRANMSGVDSPEDIQRAERLIDQHGELI